MEAEGDLPKDLFGAYVRNGPNSVFQPRNAYHWVDGDGLVHAVYFRDGKASYRSRLVPTAGLRKEEKAGHALWNGIMGPLSEAAMNLRAKDTANTDVGAAAAVGSVAGQIARIKGSRVIGIAGGPDKCGNLVDELGFDGAIDCRNENIRDRLMEGFVVFDYAKDCGAAAAEIAQWMAEGKLKAKDHIVEGIENFPSALLRLFSGEKLGKLVLEV